MEKTREIVERICDICGAPVDGCGCIVARGPDGDIIYESKVIGDYCPEHAEALWLAAVRRCGIAERYDSFDTEAEREAQKAVERALIDDEVVGA